MRRSLTTGQERFYYDSRRALQGAHAWSSGRCNARARL